MTTEAVTQDEAYSDGHEHTSDLTYVKIFVFLVAVTGIEVGLSYTDMPTAIFLILMFVAMAIKFYTVAAHFMHLRLDNPLLKRVFYFGLVLAAAVYIGFLSSMQFFD